MSVVKHTTAKVANATSDTIFLLYSGGPDIDNPTPGEFLDIGKELAKNDSRFARVWDTDARQLIFDKSFKKGLREAIAIETFGRATENLSVNEKSIINQKYDLSVNGIDRPLNESIGTRVPKSSVNGVGACHK